MNGFNNIKLLEQEGRAKIFVDVVEIKGLQEYEIKRDLDSVEITMKIKEPKQYFETYQD